MEQKKIDKLFCDDYVDVLDETLEGKTYSDDELRRKFRQGVKLLEKRGDYDLIVFNADMNDLNQMKIVIWKALVAVGIRSNNLTGRQWLHLYSIIEKGECE